MKPTVFYFDFYNEDTETSIVKGFNINEDIGGPDFIFGDEFDIICDSIEGEYGVHDWSTSPSDEVFAIGYTSYEIAPELIDEVMEKWHHEFCKIVPKSALTAIVTLGDISSKNDYEIYKEVETLTQ